jgi:hypothetical protein
MPVLFSLCLIGVVVLIIMSRFAFARRLPSRTGRPVRFVDAVLIALGTLGLVFHCAAMFYRTAASSVPFAHPLVVAINAMGPASIALFVLPAVLLMIGLRRQHPVIITIEALTLAAVGVTMYDHARLAAHLTAIFIAVVALAAIVAFVVSRRPRRVDDNSLQA